MSKGEKLTGSILDQWDKTLILLRRSIECFEEEHWTSGISDFEVPSQSDVLSFLDEVEAMIKSYINNLTEENLSTSFPGHETILGNLLYAIRHTMHHQGGLNALSVQHGIEANLWDS